MLARTVATAFWLELQLHVYLRIIIFVFFEPRYGVNKVYMTVLFFVSI